jgi:hypothetical protein
MSARWGGRVRSWVWAAWILIGLAVLPAQARYGGGQGTAAQPYLIATAAHLIAIGSTPSDWDKYFKLTGDIDMRNIGPTPYRPIGTPQDGAFVGVFDGNYKTISNFRLSSEDGNYLGLFGIVDAAEARIANLTMVDPNVADEGARYVAALVGLLSNGTVTNCHVRGAAVLGRGIVGGLVGETTDGAITDCTAAGIVRGSARVGGLLGANLSGDVMRCQAAGEVRGDASSWTIGGLIGENQTGAVTACSACSRVQGGDRAGGLIGENIGGVAGCCFAQGAVQANTNAGGLIGQNTGGTTTDCYAVAAVTAVANAGGLVGYNAPSCDCLTEYKLSLVARCYAAGPVKAGQPGGLVGLDHNKLDHYSIIEASFWDPKVTGCATSDGGGVGKTTLQMASLTTYLSAGWDFAAEKTNGTGDAWRMPVPKACPRLAWEPTRTDWNADGRVDFRDFAVLAKCWRQADTGSLASGRYVAPDGVVDFDALINLANRWLAHRW